MPTIRKLTVHVTANTYLGSICRVAPSYEFSWIKLSDEGEAVGGKTAQGIQFLSEAEAQSEKKNGAKVEQILRSGPGESRSYDPIKEPDLLKEFTEKVRDKETFKAFAERFGLLGFQEVVDNFGGDPVRWAIRQAHYMQTVRSIVGTLDSIRNGRGNEKDLIGQLPSLFRESGTKIDKDLGYLYGPDWGYTRNWRDQPVHAAWAFVEQILNRCLKRVNYRLIGERPELDGPPGLIVQFHSLLDIIAWRAATEANHLNLYRCKNCGILKMSKRRSKQTCSNSCRNIWSRKNRTQTTRKLKGKLRRGPVSKKKKRSKK